MLAHLCKVLLRVCPIVLTGVKQQNGAHHNIDKPPKTQYSNNNVRTYEPYEITKY